MNLYNLKYFVDAAKLGSMSAAADLNRLSRPAISHAIRKLESDLDVALIKHKRRSFELTAAGQSLLATSQGLLDHLDTMKDELKQAHSNPSGTYRIGCARTLATFMLPQALAKLREQFPKVRFKIIIENSENLVTLLESKKIDLALFVGDDSLHGYVEKIIDRGHFMLIKPRSKLYPSLGYAMTERRPETERVKALFKRKFSEEILVFAEIPSWDAIWHWTVQGISGGLVPSFLLLQSKNKDRVEVVIPKVFPYEVKALYSKTRAHDVVIEGLIHCLRPLLEKK